MRRAFRHGVMAGLVAPLVFVAAVIFWIHRATQRVPFPVRRIEQDEVAFRLVDPADVPIYWRPWRDELTPIWDGIMDVWMVLRQKAAHRLR